MQNKFKTRDFNSAVGLLVLGYNFIGYTPLDEQRGEFLFDGDIPQMVEIVKEIQMGNRSAPIIDTLQKAKTLRTLIYQAKNDK